MNKKAAIKATFVTAGVALLGYMYAFTPPWAIYVILGTAIAVVLIMVWFLAYTALDK